MAEEEVSVHVIEAVLSSAQMHKANMELAQRHAEENQRMAQKNIDLAAEHRARYEQCQDWLEKNAIGIEV